MSHPESRPDPRSSLGSLDRATLYLWRALNIIGWSLPGVLLAILLHWLAAQTAGFEQTAGYFRAGEFTPELGFGATARILACRSVVAIIGGLAIGQNVGHKVFTRQPLFAALAALGYAVYAMVALEHSASATADVVFGIELDWIRPNSVLRAAWHDAAILTVVPVAYFTARSIRRRGSRDTTTSWRTLVGGRGR